LNGFMGYRGLSDLLSRNGIGDYPKIMFIFPWSMMKVRLVKPMAMSEINS